MPPFGTSIAGMVEDALVSWLVRSYPDRAVKVRALAGDIVLCFWGRHTLHPIKWVPTNLILGVTLRWTRFPSRGSKNTPSHFMLQKPG